MTSEPKSDGAYRTIGEVAEELGLAQHVLRFWETRFPQIKPMKRGGNRRYYRPHDVELLRAINQLLYTDGYTIKGVQKLIKENGLRALVDGVRLTPTHVPVPAAAATASAPAASAPLRISAQDAIAQLENIRARLANALAQSAL